MLRTTSLTGRAVCVCSPTRSAPWVKNEECVARFGADRVVSRNLPQQEDQVWLDFALDLTQVLVITASEQRDGVDGRRNLRSTAVRSWHDRHGHEPLRHCLGLSGLIRQQAAAFNFGRRVPRTAGRSGGGTVSAL